MPSNQGLCHANKAKNDEFYTQFVDIEKEINAYLDFDKDVFRGKTVLLPCDDPEWSNFTKYFAQNFKALGLKKLISTSYAIKSKHYKATYQPTLWEQNKPHFEPSVDQTRGKLYILDRDRTGDGKIDLDDLDYDYLKGDGDFRSDEVKALRDQSDIVITNPPFSLFREFLSWIMEAKRKFTIIGNMNAITYKEVFPLLQANKMWLGASIHSGDREFLVPNEYPLQAAGWRIDEQGRHYLRIKGVRWFTNIDHGRRHEPLTLMTAADVFKFGKHHELVGRHDYEHYDNYDAIEVPYTDSIPSDYKGVMGVPISFLDKYCPDQFEILGMCENMDLYGLKTKVYSHEDCAKAYRVLFRKPGTYDLNAAGVVIRDGHREKVYQRILIRAKKASKGGKK